ncbi:MAG: plasma-membrane proton-efflux P-type ATPase [Holophagae bacterium]
MTAATADTVPIDRIDERLDTSAEGLSRAEAARRLAEVGPNELLESARNPVLQFLTYFWGPIPWMIEIAAVLSAAVGRWPDFGIILVLLLANGVVAYWEESQAGNAIAALKQRLAPRARVKRDREWRTIAARELVPGDIVRLRLGDIVPADVRLRDEGPLEVDQSVLTGESLPVERRQGGLLFSGSSVKRGESDAVVVATGGSTYFGKTAQLVDESAAPSHFQRAVLQIGNALIVLAAVMVALIIVTGIVRGDDLVTNLQFALVLTVAAIPVAMPAVLSVTMAVGARLLAAKNAIVCRLAAVEELAGMDVLCTDKTGTITNNQLSLGEPWVAPGWHSSEVLETARLASRAEDDDPIDTAVLAASAADATAEAGSVVAFQPFDPVAKRTLAEFNTNDGRRIEVSKGAPQAILGLVDPPEDLADTANAAVEEFAGRGYRSLGVARADGGGEWQLVGILPLYDAPRDDSEATISSARKMGVTVKMITGDQLAIGREIARLVGLGDRFLTADDLTGDDADDRIDADIERADGFAQVYPEHKHRIVGLLQQRGHITGMTGDGVNDAPALKRADCGIAVDGATDAARAAADIVLTSPGLSVIVDAIRNSREIFKRMNSYAIYRIAETVRVLLFMTASILLFNFYPVTPMMIVLLALLNDGPILAIAIDRVRAADRPERWDMPGVLGVSALLGTLGVIASFGLFVIAKTVFHLDNASIQTLIFLKLAVAGHLTIFLTRTRGPFWSSAPAPTLLWSAVATKLLATLAAVYGLLMSPIGWRWAGLVWLYSVVWFLFNDVAKRAAYRLLDSIRHEPATITTSNRRSTS